MDIPRNKVTGLYGFEGKVALVTGAGQGIGEACALRIAAEGAIVGVFDRNQESASKVARMVTESGGVAVTLIGDVADQELVNDLVGRFQADHGKIDYLVNNAGFDRPGGFLKLSPNDFRAVWDVHFLGTVHFTMACSQIMLKNGFGSIVNVSSIYGKVGCKGESAYVSAKAGIVGLSKSLAREFGRKGVRVNVIMPGLTDTPTIRTMMHETIRDGFISETPLGRIAHPSEIASAVAFLLSDEASYITGSVLEVTGGWGM